MPTRSLSATAAFATLALMAPLAAMFVNGPAAYATPPTSPTVVPSAQSGTLNAPPPPTDAVGRPAADTVVRNDGLMIGRTETDGSHDTRWATPSSDMSGLASQGVTGQLHQRSLLRPNYQTASGRLLDPQAERVLSLQLTAAGGDGLWQLSSPNGAAEPGWHDQDKAKPTPRAGGTYVLQLADGTALSELTGSSDFWNQLQTLKADKTSQWQQWTLLESPTDPGWYRLSAQADGLCANLLDGSGATNAPIGAWPCPDTSSFAANELWKPTQVPGQPGTYTFTNKLTGMLLTRVTWNGITQFPADNARNADQRWTLTQVSQPSDAIPTWSSPAPHDPSLPSALAVGDVDRSVGANGQYGDEAVVAYVNADRRLQVRVIDYNANASHLMATAPRSTLPVIGAIANGTWYPGSLGVAIGDFDGDFLNDIAVTWQDAKGFHATVLEYQAAGTARTLTVSAADLPLYSKANVTPSLIAGLADTTAGDFDGDGRDDLAIAFGASTGGGSTGAWAGFTSFTSAHAIQAEGLSQVGLANDSGTLLLPAAGMTWTTRGLKALPGLFRLDEKSGHTMGRRQLAVVWTEKNSLLTFATWAGTWVSIVEASPSSDVTKFTTSIASKAEAAEDMDYRTAAIQPMSAVAGGFAGRGSGAAIPLWGVAIATRAQDQDFSDEQDATITIFASNSNGQLARRAYIAEDSDADVAIQLTAYDRPGTSIVLGAPVVFTVDRLVKATLIGAQPPAHSDWLGGKFVNVSRTPDFAVKLGSAQESSFNFSHTTKASSTIGVSEGFDSKTSVKTGLFGVASVGGSVEVAQKFGKDWESEQSDFSKYSTTFSRSETTTGSDDDIIDALQVTNTIYRYPILGGPLTTTDGQPVKTEQCTKNCYGYYEVTIPGDVSPIHGFGRGDAWYQPTWQNGNALSYPKLDGRKVSTPDVGSYSFTDDNGQTVTKNEPLFNETNDLGGGSTSYDLTMTSGVGGGHDRTSSGSMTNSQELKVGLDVKFNVGIAKGKESAEVSAGVEEGSTWATTDTGDTDSKTSSTFGLEVPAVQENMGYRVGTAYYTDTAGVQKVVHGVDLTSNAQGSQWWLNNYGRQPDLALNLPLSTVMTKNDLGVYDDPKWSPQPNRQRIRGFYALQPKDASSPLTSGVPYASNPHAGDKVTFSVQVHNYSLKEAPAAPVDFYAVPVDALGLDVAGAPQLIGSTRTPVIGPQSMATVNAPQWTAVGPTGDSGLQNWRIFVVVDPDNSLNEIHPLKGQPACPDESVQDGSTLMDPMTGEEETLACGQNNQGYGEVTVMSGGLQASQSSGDVTLDGSSLLVGGGLTAPAPGGRPQVVVGQPVHGIVHAAATANSDDISHVLVYDGNPKKGNLIADSKLSGADAVNGGFADFDWQPATPGRHVLYQVLLADAGQEYVQKLAVDVAAHGPAQRLAVVPTAAVSVPAGEPIRLAATAVDQWGNRVGDVSRKTSFVIAPDGWCTHSTCTAVKPGEHTVTARYRGMAGVTHVKVRAAVPARLIGKSGSRQVARIGTPFRRPLVAEVSAASGRGVPYAQVTFRVTAGSAGFAHGRTSAVVTADSHGIAMSPRLTAGRRAGPVAVTATSGSATGSYRLVVIGRAPTSQPG